MLNALKSPDDNRRRVAAGVLRSIRPATEVAISALFDALKDPKREVRLTAALALGEINPAAVAIKEYAAVLGAIENLTNDHPLGISLFSRPDEAIRELGLVYYSGYTIKHMARYLTSAKGFLTIAQFYASDILISSKDSKASMSLDERINRSVLGQPCFKEVFKAFTGWLEGKTGNQSFWDTWDNFDWGGMVNPDWYEDRAKYAMEIQRVFRHTVERECGTLAQFAQKYRKKH